MKYVIFDNEDFIIIPDTMNHKDVCISSHTKTISAGFCQIEQYKDHWDDLKYKVSCWGNSSSLNLKSRSEDEAIMSFTLK